MKQVKLVFEYVAGIYSKDDYICLNTNDIGWKELIEQSDIGPNDLKLIEIKVVEIPDPGYCRNCEKELFPEDYIGIVQAAMGKSHGFKCPKCGETNVEYIREE